jgi:RNA polymerase sigma factor (sigma-70 family)
LNPAPNPGQPSIPAHRQPAKRIYPAADDTTENRIGETIGAAIGSYLCECERDSPGIHGMAQAMLNAVLHHLRRTAAEGRETASDAQLLDRFLTRRDETAFELLVWRHARLVFGVCRRVLRREADVEDAFQATFLVLVRKASAIARGGSLSSWLARVAYRVALKANATRRSVPEQPGEELSSREGDNPEVEAASRELKRLLDRELDLLPEKYRAPLVLCCLEGRTQDEAAHELGCPRGTVAVRLLRGRELLRQRLLRRGVVLSATAAVLGVEPTRAALVCETVRAGLLHAAGGAAGPRAVALAEGVLRMMWLSKLKGTLAGVLAVLALGGVGTGVVCHVSAQAGPGEDPAPIADKAPSPDPPPPSPDAIKAVLAQWAKRADAPESVVMHFEQMQNDKRYEGVVKHLRPDRYLIEVRRKDDGDLQERLIVNGDSALELMPQRRFATRLRMTEDNLPLLLLSLKPDALARRFEMQLAKQDDWYVYLNLTPRAEDRKRIRQARLVLNKETGSVRQVWVQQPGNDTVVWDVVKVDTKTPPKAVEFQLPDPAAWGWAVVGPLTVDPEPVEGEAARTKPRIDVFEQLIEELSKAQRSNDQALDAIYLAALARYPSESEQKVLADHLGRQKDRRQALRELVGRLVETQEFRRKVESLTDRLKPGGR